MTNRPLLALFSRRLRRSEDGMAAVEFSLIAPVLVLSGLAAIDVGMALTERMTVDHVLRAGANSAMTDPGEAKVKDVLKATAKKNFTECPVSTVGSNSSVQSGDCIKIEEPVRRFACPDSPGATVDDPSACNGDYYTFYRLSVTKTYASMILPKLTFTPAIEVQIR